MTSQADSNVAIWLEVKRDEKTPLRPEQEEWFAEARRRGLHVERVWNVKIALSVIEKIRFKSKPGNDLK